MAGSGTSDAQTAIIDVIDEKTDAGEHRLQLLQSFRKRSRTRTASQARRHSRESRGMPSSFSSLFGYTRRPQLFQNFQIFRVYNHSWRATERDGQPGASL